MMHGLRGTGDCLGNSGGRAKTPQSLVIAVDTIDRGFLVAWTEFPCEACTDTTYNMEWNAVGDGLL